MSTSNFRIGNHIRDYRIITHSLSDHFLLHQNKKKKKVKKGSQENRVFRKRRLYTQKYSSLIKIIAIS